MTWLHNIGKKIGGTAGAKIGDAIAGHIGKIIAAAILAGWAYLWHHANPQYTYAARPSSLGSHSISLDQIFNQVDKDSRVYCSGGWDQRLGWVGLRSCYNFTFVPSQTYRMKVCSHDEKTSEITTSDQLLALRYFERRFASLECFRVAQRGGKYDYEVVPGKDARFRRMKFANDPIEEYAWCGCSDDEVAEIARAVGASLP